MTRLHNRRMKHRFFLSVLIGTGTDTWYPQTVGRLLSPCRTPKKTEHYPPVGTAPLPPPLDYPQNTAKNLRNGTPNTGGDVPGKDDPCSTALFYPCHVQKHVNVSTVYLRQVTAFAPLFLRTCLQSLRAWEEICVRIYDRRSTALFCPCYTQKQGDPCTVYLRLNVKLSHRLLRACFNSKHHLLRLHNLRASMYLNRRTASAALAQLQA